MKKNRKMEVFNRYLDYSDERAYKTAGAPCPKCKGSVFNKEHKGIRTSSCINCGWQNIWNKY